MGLGPEPGDLTMTSGGGVRSELGDSQLVLENGQCGTQEHISVARREAFWEQSIRGKKTQDTAYTINKVVF